jgi:hypothetical protein
VAAKTWYSARLLFVSEIEGDPGRDRLCEESVIVVQEADEASARRAADRLARSMKHAYLNEQGESVQWRFVCILEFQDLCEERIESGTEVWSRLFRESQVEDPEVVRALGEAAPAPH